MRRLQQYGWLLALFAFMGLLGWIIYWGYGLRLRAEWSERSDRLIKRVERALLDKQLQLGVLAESLAPQLAKGGALPLLADNPLIKRLEVSEVVLHGSRSSRVLFSSSPEKYTNLWRGTIYDFFHLGSSRSAMELTEYGPRVLDIEPVMIGEELYGLEVSSDLQGFLENFARREGVEVAFLVSGDRSNTETVGFEVLASSGDNIKKILARTPMKNFVGMRALGMVKDAQQVFAFQTLDNVEYNSAILPSVGTGSSLVIAIDYTQEVARLSDERHGVLWMTWVVVGIVGGGFLYFVLCYRARVRLHLQSTQETLRVSNEKLRAEVVSRQKTEESLRGIADEIYSSRQNDVQLLADLSHQLKLNASATLGFVGLIRPESLSKPDQEAVDALRQLGEQSLIIGDNMALWAQREAHKKDLNLASVSLKEVVARAVVGVEGSAARKKISLKLSVPETLMVGSDSVLLEGALKNILVNAIKFSDRGRTVKLSARKIEGGTEISIEDEGRGISREVMTNLFDREMLNLERGTEGEEGLGLGLLIVKWICDLHGAQLRITSDESQGCRVVIVLK